MSAIKKGMDYFCFMTNSYQSIEVKRLKRQCKGTGIVVYTYLLNEAYRVEGYYLQVSPELVLDTAEYFDMPEEEVSHIINVCCQVGLFDSKLYTEKQILTSEEIQDRYLTACQKLKRINYSINPELALTAMPECAQQTDKQTKRRKKQASHNTQGKQMVTDIPQEESPITPVLFPQREEKKRDETREEEKKLLPPTPPSENGGKGYATATIAEEVAENTLRHEDNRLISLGAGTAILSPPGAPCLQPRNYKGMVEEMLRHKIPVTDINAILRLSNFGEIGHPAWKALHTITLSPGKFKFPGKFIISEIRKNGC